MLCGIGEPFDELISVNQDHKIIRGTFLTSDQVERQRADSMLQNRDKLLNRSHVGLQSEELREEEPKSSTQHEGDRQRTGDNRRNVQNSGESLLRNNLDRQTEAMEEEEAGNAPGRGGSGHKDGARIFIYPGLSYI